jgi:hypothetical protein
MKREFASDILDEPDNRKTANHTELANREQKAKLAEEVGLEALAFIGHTSGTKVHTA